MSQDTPPILNELDLSAYWMPFTANRQFKANPRIFVAAEGMYFTDAGGRKVLDGTAGLWCVNAGHARREIAQAVERQLLTLDYSPAFQMGHPGAFELAARLARMAPEGLDRVFFANSGSEAVDTALKIALAYHRARGEGQRTRFIGRERGYHGVGFGGMSVGGIGQQPAHLRADAARRRPPAAHAWGAGQRLRQGPAAAWRGACGRSRTADRAAWRRHHRGRDRRAHGRLDRRADPAAGLSRTAATRSASGTACS